MLKTKFKIFLTTAILLLQLLLAPVSMAANLNVRAYGTDTFAGHTSTLSTSLLAPEKKVVFVVERPDGSIVRISAQADLSGVARADFYSTQMAGVHKVAIYYPGTKDASPQNTFMVYPGSVSDTQSTLKATTQMLTADGVSQSFVVATLYDDYKNPIPNHYVTLVSSDPNVQIATLQDGLSDEFGRVNFAIRSKYTGVSTFTAFDTSANVLLSDRVEVIFAAKSSREIGGNYLNANLLSAQIINQDNVLPGPVDHFEIQDLGSSVKVNTDQTLTIVAKDKNDNVAKNYTGTVIISASDDNAMLPQNGQYTFKPEDQGQFTFNLALRFSKVGFQTLQVYDKDDWDIEGEFEVDVVSSQTVNTPNPDALSIKSPSDGSIVGSSTITLSGQGDPNINLMVYADGIKVTSTQTDSQGFFTQTLQNVSAGSHTFYVMSDFQQVSESVTVTVDTLSPVLNSIQVMPGGVVAPGRLLNIVLNTEPGLDGVTVRLQGLQKELFPVQGQPGNYSGSLAAPASAGTYAVDVILTDDLGNRSELLAQTQIMVQEDVATFPGKVKNLQAVAGNGEVTLSWDPLTGHSSEITQYNVYFGENFNALDQRLQTNGPSTSMKINSLKNGTQYFFGVSAVDSKGVESEHMSALIAVTPRAGQSTTNQPTTQDDLLNDLEPFMDPEVIDNDFPIFVPDTQDEPEATMPPATLEGNPLMGVPQDGMMTLTWQPFPDTKAEGYKVYFGLNSGQYDDYLLVPSGQTTAVVQDLINNVPYYFAVAALDAKGNDISPLSLEFTGIPSGSTLHGGAPIQDSPISSNPELSNLELSKVDSHEKVGAMAWWVAVISILFSGGLYALKRTFLKAHRSR